MQTENIIFIKITDLVPNKYQPRKNFDDKAIINLANSIKEYGVLNPILVTKVGEKYEIIAGERRYRAAKIAGLNEIPAVLKTVKESELSELALIENLHRENLNPIEEAKSYQDIIKLSNITQAELGKKIGKSQAFIANKIRLLSLPESIKNALINNKISERHARSLITVTDKQKQEELLQRVIAEKITVKELDKIISEKSNEVDEIQAAIDDIMKSLKIDEEKREEKESDNMNNGNFFPNYNNQLGADNTSLNMMNNQTMPAAPTPMAQETVMPSAPLEPVSSPLGVPPMSAPAIEEPAPAAPMMDAPLFSTPSTPVGGPTLDVPAVETPMTPEPVMPSAPLESVSSPLGVPPMSAPVIEEPAPAVPMMDAPLFSAPATPDVTTPNPIPDFGSMPSSSLAPETTPTPGFEVPISASEPAVPTTDNASKVKEFLNQNGIQYKAYSNETNQCIIIEI